jgi:excinuclease ABC subunit A
MTTQSGMLNQPRPILRLMPTPLLDQTTEKKTLAQFINDTVSADATPNGKPRTDRIVVRGAREHNLRNIDVEIPKQALTVVTGVSGSGKSTLTQHVLFAEGQRRYLESLSSYARQFLGQLEKPDVDSIDGLSPAISIDQKTTSKNPRSTVGTVSEIYDYLRLLWSRAGTPTCPECGREIAGQSTEHIIDQIAALGKGTRLTINAPLVTQRKGEYKDLFERLRGEGFARVKVDGDVRNLEEDIILDKRYKHDIDVIIDRLVLKDDDQLTRITESVTTALSLAEGLVKVDLVDQPVTGKNVGTTKTQELIFSQRFSCPIHGSSIPELEPRIFSFNSPYGACPRCTGLGYQLVADAELLVTQPELSINQGVLDAWKMSSASGFYDSVISDVTEAFKIDRNKPWQELAKEHQDIILHGPPGGWWNTVNFKRRGRNRSWSFDFQGILPYIEGRYRMTESQFVKDKIFQYMSMQPCPECQAARLRPEVLAVKVGGLSIHEFTEMSIERSQVWIETLELTEQEYAIARRVLKEVRDRLSFLNNVGLGYLTLARTATTLSGGESQRLRLGQSLGAALSGVCYILDEPSIGLHQRDNELLLVALVGLKDLGNTVIVVEHDEQTQLQADCLIDMGPGAGEYGGCVVAAGTPKQVMRNKHSITGQFLSGKRFIPLGERRQEDRGSISVKGAAMNNLKEIDVEVPLSRFVVVTGVSGSGKSTLVNEILYKGIANQLGQARMKAGRNKGFEHLDLLDKVIDIDQTPIGRTPRSNPATYTKVFDHIRQLYAQTQDARTRGYTPGHFSFNVAGGRCETCKGDGVLTIEMHFLPDIEVPCSECHGQRYGRQVLEVFYKGKTIADVLAMSVDEAVPFFSAHPKIARRLQTLKDVGLGYIKLGQPATTLSGGEAQRVKLALELSKVSTGKTIFILDEPTTGLATADIEQLLKTLNRLVDRGNTVLVIEHNLDVIKTADWIIDLGPEGGEGGGQLLGCGTPEQVAEIAASHTGHFLKETLARTRELMAN